MKVAWLADKPSHPRRDYNWYVKWTERLLVVAYALIGLSLCLSLGTVVVSL